MKISMIRDLLEAEVLCCEESLESDVYSACGSDMMSDVLAYVKDLAMVDKHRKAFSLFEFCGASKAMTADLGLNGPLALIPM